MATAASTTTRTKPKTAVLASVLAFVAGGAIAAAVLGPAWVKRRFVAAAAEEGIDATVEDVAVSFATLRFRGVTLAARDLPEVSVRAGEIAVALDGFTPKDMTASGAEIVLVGAYDEVAAKAETFAAKQEAASKSAAGGRAREDAGSRALAGLSVRGGHVVWKRIFGPATQVEAKDVTASLVRPSGGTLGDTYGLTAGAVSLAGVGSGVGPWRAQIDGTKTERTVRLFLDPKQPAGAPHVTLTSMPPSATLDVKIPRASMGSLGVPPPLVGLPASDAVQVQVSAKAKVLGADRLEADIDVSVFGMALAGAPVPADVRLVGGVAGDPQKPMDLKSGTLTIAPSAASPFGLARGASVVAAVDGKVHAVWSGRGSGRDLVGARAELAWRTGPTPCATLAKQAIAGAISGSGAAADLARQLGGLAAGAAEDAGKTLGLSTMFTATGTIAFDSTDPTSVRATVKSANACGLAIFAPP